MTLITNEIHTLDGFKETVLVSAADRRLTYPNGSYAGTRKKLFKIEYLDGCVSYFGLAEVFPGGKSRWMSEWLSDFITHHSDIETLKDFAFQLRDALHLVVTPAVLSKNHSGFHICGYNALGFPEFWYLSNIGGLSDFSYLDIQPRYQEPTSDFLDRDAKKLGWDGVRPESVNNGIWVYRNGDFRAHAVAFGHLDQVLIDMLSFPDFKPLKKPVDLAEWVRFKMEFVARFYKSYAKKQFIGKPIDVLCLTKKLPK